MPVLLAIPKLRNLSFLEPRRAAQKALVAVVQGSPARLPSSGAHCCWSSDKMGRAVRYMRLETLERLSENPKTKPRRIAAA